LSSSDGEKRVREDLDEVIKRTLQSEVELALHSTTWCDKTGDRVRTMFRPPGSTLTAIQVVDSRYILDRLCQKLDLDHFVSSYELSGTIEIESVQGLHFKALIHQFFEKTPVPTLRFCRSRGASTDGAAYLRSPNVYWVSNLDGIDAAIVLSGTLHVLRITVEEDYDFNVGTFASSFLAQVKRNIAFHQKISLHVIVPSDIRFNMSPFAGDINRQLRLFNVENPTTVFNDRTISIDCFLIRVDMTSTSTIEASLRQHLPFASRRAQKPGACRNMRSWEGNGKSCRRQKRW
jgi:hypothetical protein